MFFNNSLISEEDLLFISIIEEDFLVIFGFQCMVIIENSLALTLSKLLGQQASPYVVQGPFGFFVFNRDLQSYQKCQCWHQSILQQQN